MRPSSILFKFGAKTLAESKPFSDTDLRYFISPCDGTVLFDFLAGNEVFVGNGLRLHGRMLKGGQRRARPGQFRPAAPIEDREAVTIPDRLEQELANIGI